MIMSEVYRKSLIDTIASHGEYAKMALKDLAGYSGHIPKGYSGQG
jgi:hypothetical protein